jgi:hypothetical protein
MNKDRGNSTTDLQAAAESKYAPLKKIVEEAGFFDSSFRKSAVGQMEIGSSVPQNSKRVMAAPDELLL